METVLETGVGLHRLVTRLSLGCETELPHLRPHGWVEPPGMGRTGGGERSLESGDFAGSRPQAERCQIVTGSETGLVPGQFQL